MILDAQSESGISNFLSQWKNDSLSKSQINTLNKFNIRYSVLYFKEIQMFKNPGRTRNNHCKSPDEQTSSRNSMALIQVSV